MTIERRILVGLEDIIAISLQCEKCAFKFTFCPDKEVILPNKCASGHEWNIGGNAPPEFLPFTNAFIKIVRNLRLLQTNAMGFKIILEFREPKEGTA